MIHNWQLRGLFTIELNVISNREESSSGNLTSRIIPSFLKGKNDQNVPQKRADYELEIDERVVTFDGDAPARGTVRYIGEDKDSHGQVHTVVGLELVSETVNVVISCTMHLNLLDKHFNFFSILSKSL